MSQIPSVPDIGTPEMPPVPSTTDKKEEKKKSKLWLWIILLFVLIAIYILINGNVAN